jgi:hypothetical protein
LSAAAGVIKQSDVSKDTFDWLTAMAGAVVIGGVGFVVVFATSGGGG